MSFPATVSIDDKCDACGRKDCRGIAYGAGKPVICETCLRLGIERLTARPDVAGVLFILDGDHNPIPVHDPIAWSDWWSANRFVADVTIADVRVATIFLGLDETLGYGPIRVFFESQVFGLKGEFFEESRRSYATYAEALAGHAELVREVERRLRGTHS